jgi:hypothetical protein
VAAAGVATFLIAVVRTADSPYVYLLGSVLLVLGVGLTSPWLLEQLGRLAPRLPVGPRLAIRDAARFRTRNGPIVTAAMAGLAASITVATIATSMDVSEAATYRPSLERDLVVVYGDAADTVADDIAAEFGGRAASFRVTDLYVVEAGTSGPGVEATTGMLHTMVAVADTELADVLGGP